MRIVFYGGLFADYWASPDWQANFWWSIIGLAFSLWLVFGSRGLVRVILWARSAEVNQDELEETS